MSISNSFVGHITKSPGFFLNQGLKEDTSDIFGRAAAMRAIIPVFTSEPKHRFHRLCLPMLQY